LVALDAPRGRYVQARVFTFVDYVTDAWDEAINVSDFHPTLRREVDAALRARNRDPGPGLPGAVGPVRCPPVRESGLPRTGRQRGAVKTEAPAA
jgi:hypothetical protein